METVFVLTIKGLVIKVASFMSAIEKELSRRGWSGGGVSFPYLGCFGSTLPDGSMFQIHEVELDESYTREEME